MYKTNLRAVARVILPGLPVLLFLAFFFGVPVFEMLQKSVTSRGGGIGLDQFQRLSSGTVYLKAMGITFWISLLTALSCVVFGYPVAYFLAGISDARRSRWIVWLLIPFWTSYLVKTFAWILILSRTGVLASLAKGIGITDSPSAMAPSMMGVLIGMVHGMMPLAIMTMLPIMQGIRGNLRAAAESLGASRTESFLTVYLPLSFPGVAAAALLVFITSLGFFIVPALLGTPSETMIAQLVISAILELFNLPFAAALSSVLFAASVLVFLLYDRLVGLSTLGGDTSTAEGKRKTSPIVIILLTNIAYAINIAITMGKRLCRLLSFGLIKENNETDNGLIVKGYVWLVVLFLLLPVLIILPIAFTSSSFLAFPPKGFSLRWFESFIYSPVWQGAIVRSLLVAACTAVAAVILGFGAAITLTRLSPAWSKAFFAFLISPLIVPRIVTAVGLFYLYARMRLAGTDMGLIIGHTVLAVPYVVVTLAAALKRFDWQLDKAAYMLGASSWQRMNTVMLPLIKPSLVASFLFAFLISFDELTIAIFVSGGLKTTLPKQMWDDMLLAANPTLAAVSFVLVIAITLLILIPSLLRRTRGQ